MPKAKYNDAYKLSRDQYDPKQVINVANSFYSAANRCEERRIINSQEFEAPLVPGLVNRVFSCELYIKAILLENKIYVHGHNLSSLFQSLPPNIQKRIRHRMSYCEQPFQEKLRAISDAFEEWRYIYEYEKATFDLQFLHLFAEALKTTAPKLITHNK